MRIGILTHPPRWNYGGILQAYALQTVLERMGHTAEVFVIDRPHRVVGIRRYLGYIKRFCQKYLLLRKNVHVFMERYLDGISAVTLQYTQRFAGEHIHIRSIDSLLRIKKDDYDAIVVGSDQIWRPRYITFLKRRPVETAFLEFTNGWKIRRIAYAPSFGTDEWEFTAQQTETCKKLIRHFDAISVREQGGIRLCKEKFGVEALHVLDPTMLLEQEDYISLFETKDIPVSDGNLLCYILDNTEDKNELIDRVAEERHLQPFSVIASANMPEEKRIQPPVERWLRGFYDAEFVITDSFHACVFSILFQKQFVVYGNERRGMSRFLSLLSIFGLEDRLIYRTDQYKTLSAIDYNAVYLRLNEMRQVSMSFLQQSLS